MRKKILLLICFSFLSSYTFAQDRKNIKDTLHINNAISATNNGISLIPTFSLGKPATIFDISVGNNRFSFDPQLRFAIEDAKPWSFVFWLRYKLIESKKFKLSIGGHPSFVFQSTPAIVNGVSKEVITTKRFLASELVPTYSINKKISLGFYYLYVHGLADATRNTHFISTNGYFTLNHFISTYNLKFIPQLYYLKMDDLGGFYTTSTIILSKNKFPFSISSTINKTIHSSILSKDFIWNISLIYSFGKKYVVL
jgi:hypothetical protein